MIEVGVDKWAFSQQILNTTIPKGPVLVDIDLPRIPPGSKEQLSTYDVVGPMEGGTYVVVRNLGDEYDRIYIDARQRHAGSVSEECAHAGPVVRTGHV